MRRKVIVISTAIVCSSLLVSCSFINTNANETDNESSANFVSDVDETDGITSEIETDSSESEKKLITDMQADIWNTYWETNIVFEEGEAELCVKSDIGLPTKVDDATITWKSDNPDIIENDGTVHRPKDYSPIVNLSATIETDDGYVVREFELRVIKTELDDMKPENVWVLDEVDQVYYFNDDIDNTHVYINNDGLLIRVIGSIFEYRVDSPDEALLALYGLHQIMGCESVYDELVIDHIIKDDTGYVFAFTQVYDSYPVRGTMLTISTDLDGNTNGFASSYVPIDMSTDYSLTKEEAISKIENCVSIELAQVEIFIDDDEPKMVWYIEYVGEDDFAVNSAIIDANSGEVLFDKAMMQD